jgi:hypothetical protein
MCSTRHSIGQLALFRKSLPIYTCRITPIQVRENIWWLHQVDSTPTCKSGSPAALGHDQREKRLGPGITRLYDSSHGNVQAFGPVTVL